MYMHQPKGFMEKGKEYLVCKFNKGIYRLKQLGRVWHRTLICELEKSGFTPGTTDNMVNFRFKDDKSIELAG